MEDSNIWFGGYPYDRLNELNGNSNLTGEQLEELIHWMPLDSNTDMWTADL
jgi:hypothetical protein